MKSKKRTRLALILSAILIIAAAGAVVALVAGRGARTEPESAETRVFLLENASENDWFMRLSSVTLYADGTARLGMPLVSSFMPPPLTYSFADEELLILSATEPEDTIIARFLIEPDGSLLFNGASIFVFSDFGERFVRAEDGEEWPDASAWFKFVFDETDNL